MGGCESLLFGREAELAVFRHEMAAVEAGAGRCVVIGGPVGIGKSRLLAAAVDLATDRDMTVATGRAGALDGAAPLSTLLAVGRPGSPLARIVDSAAGNVNPAGLARLLAKKLERCAAARPLAVVLDDVQWADPGTAVVLDTLVPELADARVLWLLGRRLVPRDTPGQLLAEQLVGDGARELWLGPLAPSAVAALEARSLPGAQDTRGLLARADGNPGLLTGLIRGLRAGGDQHAVLATLRDEVDRRLHDLSDGVRRMLQAVAVLCRPFTVHEAAELTNRTVAELVPVAAEAVEAGVLVSRGDELDFQHDLVREALCHQMVRPVRLAIRREAARLGKPASEPRCVDAGMVVEALNEVGARDAGERCPVAEGVRLLASAGWIAEARELGELALRTSTTPATDAHLLLALAETARDVGDHAAVAGYVERALDCPDASAELRSRLLTLQAHVQLVGAGEPALPPQTVLIDPTCPPQPWLWLARGLAGADHFTEADMVYAAACRTADGAGPAWHYHHAELCAAAGGLADAAAEAQAGLRALTPSSPGELSVALRSLLAQIATRRNELAAARSYLHGVRGLPTGRGAAVNLAWAKASLAEAAGTPDAAIEALSWVCEQPAHQMQLFIEKPHAAPTMVRWAQRAGALSTAEAAAAAARWLADSNPNVSSLAGAAAHADGLLRKDLSALRAAVRHYRRSRRPLARAFAQEDAADAERKAGNAEAAAGLLDAAVDAYVRTGAALDAIRARRTLHAVTVDGITSAARPLDGWRSLTPSEVRVVEVIAAGMTNREAAGHLFLSPHTVDSHLRHVFTKLGINSRVELTRIYLEQGTHDDVLPSL